VLHLITEGLQMSWTISHIGETIYMIRSPGHPGGNTYILSMAAMM
jgi:hypothetical protein